MPHRLFLLLLALAPALLRAQAAWTAGRVNLPGVNTAHSIAFGNGRFVVTLGGPAGSATVASSLDGELWQPGQLSGSISALPSQGTVRFVGGMFYLAADSNLYRSLDGVVWETLPVITGFRSLRGMATDGRGFLIGTANLNDVGLLFTADRLTWRATPPLPGREIGSVSIGEIAWVAGRYFVSYYITRPSGGRDPAVAATSDGLTWESLPTLAGITHLANGNSRLVAYPVNNGSGASTDGRTFARGTVPPGIMNGGRMAFAGGRFFFLGSLYASADGLAWAPLATSPINYGQMMDIAYGNGRYVAVGYGSPPGSTALADIVARLVIGAPPIFTGVSADQTVAETGSLTVSATLLNPDSLTTFQWRRDGLSVLGANGATLTLPRVRLADAGRYILEARNSVGITQSDPITVTVVPAAEAGRIINLSVLTALDSSEAPLTVGFVVGGTGTAGEKTLLVRAGGPSLAAFGVAQPNADPRLELLGPSGTIAANDQWGGTTELAATSTAVGAFPFLAPDSRDAALVASVSNGEKTAQIRSTTNGTVIAEVYDATPAAAYSATTPRLLNVSVLKPLAANTPISAGFVLGGRTTRNVLIRAVGPSLGMFSVDSPLSDPRLTLTRSSDGTMLATNDNWAGTASLEAAMAAVGAFTLAPTSRDAALLVTLPPGNYVAEAQGAPNTAGSVLVEIYEVP